MKSEALSAVYTLVEEGEFANLDPKYYDALATLLEQSHLWRASIEELAGQYGISLACEAIRSDMDKQGVPPGRISERYGYMAANSIDFSNQFKEKCK